MNQDDIIRMAREGKSVVEQVHAYVSVNNTDFTSESMSAMVHDFIVAERVACAYRASIALLGADRELANRVDKAIRVGGSK
jgi:hypothetical protein